MTHPRGPVLIDLDAKTEVDPISPADAPAVADAPLPQGQAMQAAVQVASYRPSRLGRWFFTLLGVFVPFILSIAAWNYVTALLAANPILGAIASALLVALVLVLLAIAAKELAGFSRLRRLDRLQKDALAAQASDDLGQAQQVADRLRALYHHRSELAWNKDRFDDLRGDALDPEALFALAEREFMTPLDHRALREVEAATRQVATVTALVPIALADVVVALTANLRMIRKLAEIYGGRAGALGSWRLTRSVFAHLIATGAVALGDDLIGSLAGGGMLSKLSRRFGEGVVNGALTARVGIAAIEVCRPLPFRVTKRPSVSGVVKRAVTGLFAASDKANKDLEM